MSDPPRVSVVVPTHRRPHHAARLVRALGAQDLDAAQFEVVVSVDGSEPDTVAAVREAASDLRAQVRIVEGPHRGRAGACNRGIAAAHGGLVLLLDDDMVPAPECLTAHVAAHADGVPRCVVGAAPVPLPPTSPPLARLMGAKFNRHLERLARPGHAFALRDFYSGHCSMPRAVLDRIGRFDERFVRYGNEDLELSVRLREAGVPIIFAADAVAEQTWDKRYAAVARDHRAKGGTSVTLVRIHPETLPELRLGAPDAASRRWRRLRTTLVALSGGDVLPRVVVGVTGLLERHPPRRMEAWYVLTLDYFYWLGVREAGGRAAP